jgi:hypothetical protein
LTETLSTTQRDAEQKSPLFFSPLSTLRFLAIIPSPTHSFADRPAFQLPQIPWPPQLSKLGPWWEDCTKNIMRWLERSRWTTSPYYALVIFVIACGSIPKGMQLTS